ncbi:MAG: very short patch repair endonuclease [Thermoplasmatales archaeon]|jgi:DNA mismatch endonuclease (patch repair protein)|nr:very short patch repair endonuclease [Thermoplasmatales archaeon]
MADNLSREKRSKVMASIKGKNTKPELLLWNELDKRRFRQFPKIHGNPDMGNVSRKIAIFVDGCFWHGCPICYKPPSSRHEYWSSKLRRNFEHDQYVNNNLKDSGYMVIRFWEHEILSDVSGCTLKINEVLA